MGKNEQNCQFRHYFHSNFLHSHVHVLCIWLVATLKGGRPASKGGGECTPRPPLNETLNCFSVCVCVCVCVCVLNILKYIANGISSQVLLLHALIIANTTVFFITSVTAINIPITSHRFPYTCAYNNITCTIICELLQYNYDFASKCTCACAPPLLVVWLIIARVQ